MDYSYAPLGYTNEGDTSRSTFRFEGRQRRGGAPKIFLMLTNRPFVARDLRLEVLVTRQQGGVGSHPSGRCFERSTAETRFNRILTHAGRCLSVAEWAEELQMPVGVLHGRLKRGWSDDRVVTEPYTPR
jgi:hypothetical protein